MDRNSSRRYTVSYIHWEFKDLVMCRTVEAVYLLCNWIADISWLYCYQLPAWPIHNTQLHHNQEVPTPHPYHKCSTRRGTYEICASILELSLGITSSLDKHAILLPDGRISQAWNMQLAVIPSIRTLHSFVASCHYRDAIDKNALSP